MAQNPPRLCPKCGTPAEPNQRFCSECGTTLNVASNQPTAMASGEQSVIPSQGAQFATQPEPGGGVPGNTGTAPTQMVGASGQTPGAYPATAASASGAQFYSQTTDANPIPPPPPPDSLVGSLYQSTYQAPTKTPSSPSQATQAPGAYTVPDYARAPRRSRLGLIVSLVLLLVLVLGGVAAYALFFNKSNNTQGGTNPQHTATTSANSSTVTATTGTGNSASTPGSSSTTPTTTASTTPNGATTEQVNLAFAYSGINLTITSVQYASSFPDDSSLSAGGVRIAFNENNAATSNPNFLYSDVARLILPDHSSVAPTNELHGISPASQITEPNWLDFAVTSQPADLSQLTLQMGTAQENQMQISLKPGADLAKYQPKTVTPGTSFQYAGLNWTLVSATESLSVPVRQATTGNVFITVALKVFNPTGNAYSALASDYVRLQAGGTSNAPTSETNFPITVDSQATISGTMIFLAPQGTTSFTLVMLGSSNPPVKQVTAPFTIQ
jgi:hypothetical protein